MAKLNKNYQKLQSSYLFRDIAKRTRTFIEKNPDAQIYRLGIGDTTEPLPTVLLDGLSRGVKKLAERKTYSGYGDEQGNIKLREALVDWYAIHDINLSSQEIFISDGAKPDTANIQSIFSFDSIVAIQDPVYPVYVDTNVIAGRTGNFTNGKYKKLVYMACNKENNFFPKLPQRHVDIIYICSPNNPTGTVATRKQLQVFVDYAREHKAIIIFDAAYSMFINDSSLPRSIYEINGAKECAIEISSFSKWAGFTGVRLGWTIVPMNLLTEDAMQGEVNALWNRRQTTMFNGASNIAQEGGLAVLNAKGQKASKKLIDYYMGNARIIRECLTRVGLEVFGGENAPYIWLKTPENFSSWEFFDKLLNETHVVGTPGSGFGPNGEGYLRLSAFGHRENVSNAVKSIEENLQL